MDASGSIDTLVDIESMIGSAFRDLLIGSSEANFIDGGGGYDDMAGGDGNDTYVIDSSDDLVVESAAVNAGIDTVLSRITIAALVANVENLTLADIATAIDATGNGLDNIITGNSFLNALSGGAGDDRIYGGDDLLADILSGGVGNDTYMVAPADVIIETAGQGTADRALTSQSYALAASTG